MRKADGKRSAAALAGRTNHSEKKRLEIRLANRLDECSLKTYRKRDRADGPDSYPRHGRPWGSHRLALRRGTGYSCEIRVDDDQRVGAAEAGDGRRESR